MKSKCLKTRLNTIGAVTLQTIIITAVLAIAGAGVAIIVYNTVEGKTDNLTTTGTLVGAFSDAGKAEVDELAAGASSFEEAEATVVAREAARERARAEAVRVKQRQLQQIALYDHTCVIRETNREVWCWGSNGFGQLGSNAVVGTNSPVPVQVPGLSNIQSVAVGEAFSCALLMDKTVKCWGDNTFIQLGSGTTLTQSPAPVKIVGITNAISISAGQKHACAIIENGTARCWGDSTSGKLGDGSLQGGGRPSPAQVTESIRTRTSLRKIVQISAGNNHTCVVLRDGAAKCWGISTSGQLGNGTKVATESAPIDVIEIDNAVSISAGSEHTCALLADKTVKCWGKNHQGQLGQGVNRFFIAPEGSDRPSNFSHISTPSQVVGITTAISISVGSAHTCVILEAGTTDSLERVSGSSDSSPTYATETLTVAEGTASCWGVGNTGQLGYDHPATYNAPLSPYSPIPNLVIESDASRTTHLMDIVAIIGGSRHTCAILEDRTARCWGGNHKGQLGNEPITDPALRRPTPSPVLAAGGAALMEIRTGPPA